MFYICSRQWRRRSETNGCLLAVSFRVAPCGRDIRPCPPGSIPRRRQRAACFAGGRRVGLSVFTPGAASPAAAISRPSFPSPATSPTRDCRTSPVPSSSRRRDAAATAAACSISAKAIIALRWISACSIGWRAWPMNGTCICWRKHATRVSQRLPTSRPALRRADAPAIRASRRECPVRRDDGGCS